MFPMEIEKRPLGSIKSVWILKYDKQVVFDGISAIGENGIIEDERGAYQLSTV